MNVHDWLMNLPFSDPESSCKVIEVSFKQGSRKEFFRNPTLQYFEKGEYVTVEGVSGFDVGEVSISGEMVRLQLKKRGVDEFNPDIKRVLRKSSDRDIELFKQNKAREQDALMRSRAIARSLKLQMKLSEVEFQADGKKATFFYTADDRVDFREMIKSFAGDFKTKVEMRQIGIRQEAGKVGGIGSCGRELCCSTWLTDFKSVITTAARYQNLSINQTKLSGQCGRLKCCLNYELDTYLDALQNFPDNAENIQTTKGNAHLIKKDIFKNLMWYVLPDTNKQYPLTIQRVKEIQRLNARGEKPDDLQPVDLTSKTKEVEPVFVDVVGQISLRSLERNDKRRKDRERGQGQQRNQGPRNDGPRNQGPRQQDARGQGPRNEGPRQQDSRNQGPRNQGNQPRAPQQPQRPPQQRPTQNRPPQQKPPEDKK
jgi:cell fate regulator YaaT (PSP1 superfamily)